MQETMNEGAHVSRRQSGLLGKILFGVLGLVLFLMPVFFAPSALVPFQTGKGLVFMVGTVIAAILYIVTLIKEGKVTVPKNLLSLSILLIPVTFLISGLIHGAPVTGLIGYSLEMGTVLFVAFAALLLFLVSEVFETKEEIVYSYLAFFASFAIVALFQLIRLFFGSGALSFGIFTSSVGNLLGNWNDLGIFFGVATILSLISLEMLELNKMFKWIAYSVFVISLLFLTLVNFTTIWVVLGVFGLLVFIYVMSFERFAPSQEFAKDMSLDGVEPAGKTYRRKISYNALAVIIVSVLFLIAGNALGAKIAGMTGVNNVEVRPAWGTTLSVVKSALTDNLIAGTGPNAFTHAWLMHKPTGINETIFWSTDFAYGIGAVPTFFATTGILGILAWFFFFVMFIWVGVRAMFYSLSDLFSRYLITSSFMVALFLWIMAVFYVPSSSIFVLTFFFTGLFMAAIRREGLLKVKTFSLVNHPKLSFVAVIVLVALLVANVTLGYFAIEKVVSQVTFQKGVLAVQSQKIDEGEASMVSAAATAPYDIYYRGLSQVELLRVNNLLSKQGATPESIKEPFQQGIGNAIENARKATLVDGGNYQNWLALAQVYAVLVPAPFSIPGAYENAKAAYEAAQKVSPHDPNIPLLLARLEVAHKDLEKARGYTQQAIALKQSFADAHFLMAQIEASEGNLAKAIEPLKTTLILSPGNPGLYFQLGLLEYDQKDYVNAIDAFARAVSLVPDYANAKYFLGLALDKVGRTPEAIGQFQDLQKTNPDNQDVKNILSNLEAGKDAFANVAAPKNKPEKAANPPIPQKN